MSKFKRFCALMNANRLFAIAILSLSSTLIACTAPENFASGPQVMCAPPGNSARYGITQGPVIMAPPADQLFKNQVTISGTCVSGTSVVVSGSGDTGTQTVPCNAGAFSAVVTATNGDGAKQVEVTQTIGTSTPISDIACFNKDTVPPTVTISGAGMGTLAVVSNSNNKNIGGTCTTGINVILSSPNLPSSVTTSCPNGTWATDINFDGPDGTKTITATQTDPIGNTGNAQAQYNIGTVAPVVTITSPAENSYVKGSITLTGTCENGYNVVVQGTGVLGVYSVPCSGGTYSNMTTLSAGDGLKPVNVSETDMYGNVGTANSQFNKLTIAPVVTITSPANGAYENASFTITGACKSGLNVVITGNVASPLTTMCSSGAYSGSLALASPDGAKTVTATQTDQAGNVGTATATYNLLTTPPVVTITSPASGSYERAPFTISGSCKAGLNVVLGGTGLAAGVTTACSAGTYSTNVSLASPDGSKTVTATQTDQAGNVGMATATYNLLTTPPVVTILLPAAGTYEKGAFTISGNCESGLNVVIGGSGVASPATTMCASGAYSASINLAAPDGTKTVTATQTDQAGNIGTATTTYNRLTIGPVVTITSPANGAYEGGSALTITGTCESGLTVILTGGIVTSPTTTSCTSGAFSTNITLATPDGAKIVTATQTDLAGNAGTASVTYNRLTTGPAVAITSPVNGSYENGSAFTITGTCESGLNVILTGGITVSPTTTVCSSGAFSTSITLISPDGAKTVTATQTDLAGNVGTATVTYNRLTVAPVVTITSPANGSYEDAGFTITGTCESGINVILSGGIMGSPVTTACTSGAWSTAITLAAPDGAKTVTATQTDLAGNVGTASATYNRLTVGPTVTITSPAANSYENSSFTISGTCESGLTVTIGGAITAPVSIACTSGAYSTAITLAAPDGAKTVTASQTDLAGNVGTASITYNRLTVAPVVTITSPSAGTYEHTAFTITGTCESGVNVVLSGGIVSPVTTACTSGAFSASITLAAPDGAKTVTATQTDLAGNVGTASITYNRLTVGPTVTITSPASGSYENSAFTITGTCESGLTVSISGAITAPVSTACTSGAFSASITLATPDGAKTVTATQTDLAGNVGTASVTYNRLTVGPTVTITSPANGTYENASAFTITGTCESGLNIVLTGGIATSPTTTSCASGAFSASITLASPDGAKTVTATQTDLAGNVGSASRTFNRLTVGPTVTITSPAANSYENGAFTISGSCESGINVVLSGGITSAPVTTSCTSGAWSTSITLASPDGAKTVTATQTDMAGNVGSASITYNRLTVGPTVTITSPAAGSYENGNFTITGTCESGLSVSLGGSGILVPVSANCTSGAFSATIGLMPPDGAKTITASQTDAAGNTGTATITYNRLTVAPVVTITSPAANSYENAAFTISGTCETGLNIVLSGGIVTGVTTSCTAGTWSTSIALSAPDGVKTVTATQTDLAGNVGSASITYNRLTVGPAVTITSPAANSYENAAFTITGTCESGLTVSLTGGITAAPVTTSCTSGAFSTSITLASPDGAKTVTATQTDLAGNVGSASRTFNRLTVGPTVTITSPAAGSYEKGPFAISGTCETGISVVLSGNISTSGSTPCNAGAFSATITLSAPDGAKTVTATQTDAAGNIGTASITYNLLTTPPVVTITSPAANSYENAPFTLTGTCESGLNVSVTGVITTPTTVMCSGGAFSTTVTLSAPDGAKTVTATQTDLAGNVGSASITYNRLYTAPVVTITSPAAGAYENAPFAITGTCETGISVVLSGNISTPGPTPCNAGAFSTTITLSSPDGAKTVTATQTDLAGNVGTASRTFNLLTAPPTVTITSPVNGSTVTSGFTLTGTCETGITVYLTGTITSANTACSGGAFSLPIAFSATSGNITVTATQTDLAGNVGTASDTYAIAANLGSDSFTSNGPGGKIDILFSDDNAYSMEADQTNLGSGFPNFASALAGVNWQAGIITSDCTSGSSFDFCGQLQPMVGTSPSTTILTPSTPSFDTVFQNTIVRPESNFNCILTDSCASGVNQNILSASTAFTLQNTTDSGFFRSNANLAVVIISNSNEMNQATPPAGAETPAQFVSNFNTAFAGSNKQLVVYSIVVESGDSTCLAAQTNPLTGPYGNYGTYYQQLATLTGGQSYSICAANYSPTMTAVAAGISALGNVFKLSHTPLTGTLTVTFTPSFTTTWTVTGNEVTLAAVPPPGTTIQFNYQY